MAAGPASRLGIKQGCGSNHTLHLALGTLVTELPPPRRTSVDMGSLSLSRSRHATLVARPGTKRTKISRPSEIEIRVAGGGPRDARSSRRRPSRRAFPPPSPLRRTPRRTCVRGGSRSASSRGGRAFPPASHFTDSAVSSRGRDHNLRPSRRARHDSCTSALRLPCASRAALIDPPPFSKPTAARGVRGSLTRLRTRNSSRQCTWAPRQAHTSSVADILAHVAA